MSQKVSKWSVSGWFHLRIDGVYWDYNPLTNHLLTFWDIQVGCCLLLLVAGCWLFKRPDHSGDRRCSSILSEPSLSPDGRPKAILSTTVTWELLRSWGWRSSPNRLEPPTHQSWKTNTNSISVKQPLITSLWAKKGEVVFFKANQSHVAPGP